MKVVIIPILNLITLLVVLFIYLPIQFVFMSIWDLKFNKPAIDGYNVILGDFKRTMKDTFCSEFLLNQK